LDHCTSQEIEVTRYFLGIDTGATKSHALVADEAGRALGWGAGGTGNHEVVGYEGLVETLQAITGQALHMAGISKGQLAGAGFGIAGYDWPAEREPTRQAIQALGLAAPFELVNDTVIGLLAGATEGWGVAVVAGTSNNCRGRDRQGREGRVTGNGSHMGEYGGAHEVVERAVHAIAGAWAQRGPTTCLSEAFVELVGAKDVVDLLQGLALDYYQLSAAAAPLVFQLAAAGDQVAHEIVCWAGRELGSLATGVIRQLSFEPLEFEVILVGSMFSGSPVLVEALADTIHAVAPQARLVRLTAPPAVGGVLLGMEQAGIVGRHVRPRLIETSSVMLGKL
jgi:N-acetylglucosamine kinase-like BadF-type ATPase